MATDTLEEKAGYPCEPATEEELLDAIARTVVIWDNDCEKLRRMTVKIPTDQIPWSSVHTLCVLGRADSGCNAALEEAGLKSGVYVNRGGDWLILIHPEESAIQAYADHCKTRLQFLGLYHTTLPELVLPSLTALKRLQVWDNKELSSIYGLENLTQLTKLDLSQCTSLTALPGLDKLTQIIQLDLSWCQSLAALPCLENLTQLTELNLSGCYRLTALPDLDHLTQLTELNLSCCKSLTTLPGLDNLIQLTKLDLSECSSLTTLPGLDKLTQLTELNLSGCSSLTALPGLDKLTQVTTLNLFDCSSLTALHGLGNLTQLTELSLSECSSLTALPGLENLTQLTELNLFGCSSLTALPGLEHLMQITDLNLSGCGISELPTGIRSMNSLRYLDLRNMNLRELPDWLPEIAEGFSLEEYSWQSGENKAIVYLGGTTVENIPDMSIFEQPYEMVVEWFKNRDKVPLNEIKVVFLGDGEAGKSHTIARLMNDGGAPVGYVNVRTPGIVIKDLHYPVGDREATLHLWDFGGQDIMHSMHRIFLTERTIYVVLVDGSIGNQDERARYWLQNIQSFAKDAPVVLVLNKLDDGLQADVNEVDLHSKYPGLTRIVKLSALQYTKEQFNQKFRDVLLDEIEKTGYLDAQWPSSWIRVKEALEQMDENYIHGGEYLKICKKLNVDENQKPLLQWFHDLGISFCYCDDENKALEDYVVLKPNWITNALYIILFNEREGGNGGLVPIRTIRNMLGWDAPNKEAIKRVIPDAYYVGYDVNYVLDVFHTFKLSFRKDEQHEFFPMLADINAKPVANEYAKDADCLEFNMEFDYLPPNNLLHRLMVERHDELDTANVWRTGARFELKELGFSAVVVIDGNTLRFFIRHTDSMYRPNTYLTMLKANVDRIIEKMGLKAPTSRLIYKLDGKRDIFDFEMLKAMLEAGQTQAFSMTWRRMIPIADILNQSAPDGLEDEKKLLDAILRSCKNIQGEPDYYLAGDGHGLEDKRNRRIRDDLHGWGYNILDQTQRGLSGSRKGIGELDLLLFNDKREPWTVIEALRISDGSTTEWKKHLTKLIGNYNYFGAPFSYLLTYVDANDFGRIWEEFKVHIQGYAPEGFTCRNGSFAELNDANSPQYIKTAKCQYSCGGEPITVYHIFARIPTLNE